MPKRLFLSAGCEYCDILEERVRGRQDVDIFRVKEVASRPGHWRIFTRNWEWIRPAIELAFPQAPAMVVGNGTPIVVGFSAISRELGLSQILSLTEVR